MLFAVRFAGVAEVVSPARTCKCFFKVFFSGNAGVSSLPRIALHLFAFVGKACVISVNEVLSTKIHLKEGEVARVLFPATPQPQGKWLDSKGP